MAVLGLISQGRSTAAALHSRLDSEFPHANYAPNAAHTGLARLAQKGQVRLVREGEQPPQDVYEITELGLRRFEEWLYEIAIVPTPLRDPLQGKLMFIPSSDNGIERLIETIRTFEEAAAHNYGSEHGKINTLSISGLDGNPRLELQRIRLKYTATVWGQEAKRLASLRRELEEFQAKAVRPTG
jgi:DNA-binding PadR family transcriptional regulator